MSQLLGPAFLQSWGHARCKLIERAFSETPKHALLHVSCVPFFLISTKSGNLNAATHHKYHCPAFLKVAGESDSKRLSSSRATSPTRLIFRDPKTRPKPQRTFSLTQKKIYNRQLIHVSATRAHLPTKLGPRPMQTHRARPRNVSRALQLHTEATENLFFDSKENI